MEQCLDAFWWSLFQTRRQKDSRHLIEPLPPGEAPAATSAQEEGNDEHSAPRSITAATHTPNMFQKHARLIFMCYTVQNDAAQFELPL